MKLRSISLRPNFDQTTDSVVRISTRLKSSRSNDEVTTIYERMDTEISEFIDEQLP